MNSFSLNGIEESNKSDNINIFQESSFLACFLQYLLVNCQIALDQRSILKSPIDFNESR